MFITTYIVLGIVYLFCVFLTIIMGVIENIIWPPPSKRNEEEHMLKPYIPPYTTYIKSNVLTSDYHINGNIRKNAYGEYWERYERERIATVQQLTDYPTQAIADLYKHSVSLIDENIFKTDREMKRYFIYMSEREIRNHKHFVEQYTECIREIVDTCSKDITHILSMASPNPDPIYVRWRIAIPYRTVPSEIDRLCNEAREQMKLATRDYWCLIYMWIRGGMTWDTN